MFSKLSKYIYVYISLMLITACSLFPQGPQPHVIYERTDLTNPIQKLIIFPTTDFNGKETTQTKAVDASVNGQWTNIYGTNGVIPAGLIIKKAVDATGKQSYNKFIATLDNVSAIEQLASNLELKKFTSMITDKIAATSKGQTKYHFALAIMSGGEKEYSEGTPVYLHLGLFDVEHFTWKVITKIEIKKGKSPLAKWHIDSQQAINNSFNYFDNMNKEAIANNKK